MPSTVLAKSEILEPTPFPHIPSMINLEDDRLTFTFPEIARQLRAHVERQIGHIRTGAQRRLENSVILSLSKDL